MTSPQPIIDSKAYTFSNLTEIGIGTAVTISDKMYKGEFLSGHHTNGFKAQIDELMGEVDMDYYTAIPTGMPKLPEMKFNNCPLFMTIFEFDNFFVKVYTPEKMTFSKGIFSKTYDVTTSPPVFINFEEFALKGRPNSEITEEEQYALFMKLSKFQKDPNSIPVKIHLNADMILISLKSK